MSGVDLVTGGTGFVGAHVVRALRRRGRQVRCLVRPASDTANLAGIDAELFAGDLADARRLREAASGCRRVFHCAADYRLWAKRPRELYETNVDGTERLLAAAAAAGVERVVHTSSVGALGQRADGAPANENTPVRLGDLAGHYKRSKFMAERVAERWARRGLPVVIVNPSTPIGELDLKPTPTGRIVVDFLSGRIPAYVDTGLNLVDVRDVAEGHLLAAERGAPGEKYILGAENLTLREIFDRLATIAGRRAPRFRLPIALPLAFAAVLTGLARLTGRPPRVPLDGVRMARKSMFFEARKATDRLGFSPSPVDQALARAVRWFVDNGYVQR